MSNGNLHSIETLSASPKWQQVGTRNVNVVRGKVTLEMDTGVLRCAEHGLRLVFNMTHDVNICPACSASAISLMAEM